WGEKVGGGGDRGGGGAGRKRGKERAVEKEIDKTGRAAKTRRYLLAGIRHPLEANHIGVAGRLRRVRPLAEVRVPYEGQRRVRPVFRAPRSATRARTWLPEVRVPDHADRRARLVLRDHVWPGSMRATGPPLFQAPIQASPKAIPIAPRPTPSPRGTLPPRRSPPLPPPPRCRCPSRCGPSSRWSPQRSSCPSPPRSSHCRWSTCAGLATQGSPMPNHGPATSRPPPRLNRQPSRARSSPATTTRPTTTCTGPTAVEGLTRRSLAAADAP